MNCLCILKEKYQDYLDYMFEYEEEHGYYPMHISDGHWTYYSFEEWKEKSNNGEKELR